jgi:hypothetical protein
MTTVNVNADDLERLVRSAHQVMAAGWICQCGWRAARAVTDSDAGALSKHGSHVEHVVREALAGRIVL